MAKVSRWSGGTAPYLIASAEAYDGGCVRYTVGRTARCVCDDRLKDTFAPAAVDDIAGAMRIAPRNWADAEEVSVQHGALVADRAVRDLPKRARTWLAEVDAVLRPLIGEGYKGFTDGS